MKKALEKLGALKTASLLDELISLVPEWECFFEGETECCFSTKQHISQKDNFDDKRNDRD